MIIILCKSVVSVTFLEDIENKKLSFRRCSQSDFPFQKHPPPFEEHSYNSIFLTPIHKRFIYNIILPFIVIKLRHSPYIVCDAST